MIHRTFPISLLALALVAAGGPGQNTPSSKGVKDILENAEQFELYSLNPTSRDKEGFNGWKVLGKTAIKDADTRKAIVDALYKGLADSDGKAAKCFDPRHGIRATGKGKTVDVVICFECYQALFRAGGKSKTETLTRSPEKTFDEVLTKSGVPLAKKGK